MQIMIVDDNASMRKVLAALFASAGHEVVGVFGDGNGVEEHIRETKPEVVCLDYHLPGRDGLTILRAIQATAPTVDVVFMTASSDAAVEPVLPALSASLLARKRSSRNCGPSSKPARLPGRRRSMSSVAAQFRKRVAGKPGAARR